MAEGPLSRLKRVREEAEAANNEAEGGMGGIGGMTVSDGTVEKVLENCAVRSVMSGVAGAGLGFLMVR
jgi:hypothetical protein